MTFQKNNEYCWKPEGKNALDSRPLCFKIDSELKAQLKAIPGWQRKLRDVLPSLIVEWQKEI